MKPKNVLTIAADREANRLVEWRIPLHKCRRRERVTLPEIGLFCNLPPKNGPKKWYANGTVTEAKRIRG
jgi:hypothetical protein